MAQKGAISRSTLWKLSPACRSAYGTQAGCGSPIPLCGIAIASRCVTTERTYLSRVVYGSRHPLGG